MTMRAKPPVNKKRSRQLSSVVNSSRRFIAVSLVNDDASHLRFKSIVAVIVVDEIYLVGRHEHQVRQKADRCRVTNQQTSAVVVGRYHRQRTTHDHTAMHRRWRRRRRTSGAATACEVVPGVDKWRIGTDGELSGFQLKFVTETKVVHRRRTTHVQFTVSVLRHVNVCLHWTEEADFLNLNRLWRKQKKHRTFTIVKWTRVIEVEMYVSTLFRVGQPW